MPASIHLRPSPIRKLAAEAAEKGRLNRCVAQGIVSLKGVRQSGNRAGNWLTGEQARRLLARPDIDTIEGKRDRAILTVLLGWALAGASSRRSNAAGWNRSFLLATGTPSTRPSSRRLARKSGGLASRCESGALMNFFIKPVGRGPSQYR